MILALPAPSLQRHLARTIDAASLTSVPDEYTAPPRSAAEKRRERQRTEREWLIQNARFTIEPASHMPKSVRLWAISSHRVQPDGSTNHTLSTRAATSEADAKRRHRRYCDQQQLGKEVSIIAMCLNP